MTKWNCLDCGWTTADNTINVCPDCKGNMLLIPRILDNTLYLATLAVIEDYYHGIYAILNYREDGVEILESTGHYVNEIMTVIRNWSDFYQFFGAYFYRKFKV